MAITPQITKSYAAKDFAYINRIIIAGTKYSFFLLCFISLPVCLNTEYLLGIWLKEVPPYTAEFVRLGIIYSMCQTLSQCLFRTMLASGKIKKYQIVVGSLSLMTFPAAYLFFYIGLSATWGYWAMIIFSIICLAARMKLLKEILPEFSARSFSIKALLKIIFTITPVILITFYLHTFVEQVNTFSFVEESLRCVVLTGLSVWLIGLSSNERQKYTTVLQSKLRRHRDE